MLTGPNSGTSPSLFRRGFELMRSPNAHASLHVLVNQAFSSAGNFLVTVWLIRRLGLTDFGTFFVYFLAAQSISILITALTVAPAISTAGTRDSKTQRDMLVSASLIAVAGNLALLPLLFLAAGLSPMLFGFELSAPVLFALIASISLTDLTRRFLIFVGLRIELWIVDAGRFTLLATVFVWELRSPEHAGHLFFLGALAGSNGLILILVALWRARTLSAILPPHDFSGHARHLLGLGSWLSLSSLMKVISDNIFMFVGAALLGSKAVGIMRACDSIVGLINPLMLALENIIPKWLGDRIRVTGSRTAARSYRLLGGTIGLAIALVLGLIALFAGPVLTLIAGPEATQFVWVMQITCAAYMTGVATTLYSYMFRAQERTRPIALSLTVSAFAAAFLAWPLIEGFGLGGLAAGFLIIGALRFLVLALQRRPDWRSSGIER